MNYGELKTEVLALAHRPDLTDEVEGFIRRAEGLIRRDLRAYVLTDTLEEVDRDSEGVYDLPSTLLELRQVWTTDVNGTAYPLEQKGLDELRNLSATANPIWYSLRGDNIEFRGVPATDTEFEIEFLGHPAALAADGDENDLLTNHEALYIEGALFELYKFTQDIELAERHEGAFNDVIEKLNQQIGRKLGGGGTAPGYNLGNYRTRGSY